MLKTQRRLHCKQLPETASVRRANTVSNGGGGDKVNPITPDPALKCRVTQVNQPRQRDEAGRSPVVSEFDIALGDPDRDPAELNVLSGDFIVVGRTAYEVIRTDKGNSEAVLLTCRCVRAQ